MFTGLVGAVGAVESAAEADAGASVCALRCPAGWLADATVGDSIAVNGACVTITARADDVFECRLSRETRQLTTPLVAGGRVNLEQALAVGDRLGGHIVTGHVDGVATVASVTADDDDNSDNAAGATLRITPPPALLKLIAPKCSVALAGVSLTVNAVDEESFSVYLLPHTRRVTTLRDLTAGASVNIETDILARHVARLLNLP